MSDGKGTPRVAIDTDQAGVASTAAPDNNLVLRQLQGIRREFAAVLENQSRDRELIIRLHRRIDEGFDKLNQDLREARNDLFSMENKILNRDNEILEIVRRLDENVAPTPTSDPDGTTRES